MINLNGVFTGLIDAHVRVTVRFNYFFVFINLQLRKITKKGNKHIDGTVTVENFKMKIIITLLNVLQLITGRSIVPNLKAPDPNFARQPR